MESDTTLDTTENLQNEELTMLQHLRTSMQALNLVVKSLENELVMLDKHYDEVVRVAGRWHKFIVKKEQVEIFSADVDEHGE